MENVDLSHHFYRTGKLGRMLGVGMIPVYPGDEIDMSLQIRLDMSPLRQPLSMDVRVDVASFYVKHRFIYSNFQAMVRDGVDTAETLSTTDISSYVPKFIGHWSTLPTAKPDWYHEGPLKIYNRFYRPLSAYADPDANQTTFATAQWGAWTTDDFLFGPRCANLPTQIWNVGVDRDLEDADFDVDVSGSTLDITKIFQQKMRLKTERNRQFHDYFYDEVIKARGGSADSESEDRPELIAQSTVYLGGENIHGTDNQSLGSIAGRPGGEINHRLPSRFIPEHGIVWTFITVRYPHLCAEETHYLVRNANTYLNSILDPDVTSAEPPIDLQLAHVFDTAASDVIQKMPYANWARIHPSHVDVLFQNQFGFVFAKGQPSANIGENYYDVSIDDSNFHSTQFNHFKVQMKSNVFVDRFIPSAEDSIMAGTA